MGERTAIEWTDHTWSPWEGCTKVSPACDHCYAEARNRWLRRSANWGPGAARHEFGAAHWDKPLKWHAKAQREGRRTKVFPSVCDPFDNEVPDEWRAQFWTLIAGTPHLTWLLLTKRIGNARSMLPLDWGARGYDNVWLGSTVVTQAEADRDIPKLLAVPGALRFLSIEPMLGPVSIFSEQTGELLHTSGNEYDPGSIDWVICGGESGPKARPLHPDWARSLRDECAAAGVPFFFKQWGEFLPASANDADPGLADVPPSRVFWSDGAKWDRFDGQRGGVEMVARIGKAAAGRLLDGRKHDEFPRHQEPRAAIA
jgi:protein gp37